MAETKVQLTDRLRREARWDDAAKFRDEARRSSRKGGMSRADANEESWRLMAEKFPALTPGTSNKLTETLTEPVEPPFPTDLPPSDGDFVADLSWAFKTIGDDVGPHDASNGSAWLLRVWGRSKGEHDKFFAMAAKLLKRNSKADRFAVDRRRQFALLDALRHEFSEKDGKLVVSKLPQAGNPGPIKR